MAAMTAMLLSFVVAPWFIQKLRGKQISQIIREEGPATHLAKKGTPDHGRRAHFALGSRADRYSGPTCTTCSSSRRRP
jgi:hypothetical protein